jgi:hypothetical protein
MFNKHEIVRIRPRSGRVLIDVRTAPLFGLPFAQRWAKVVRTQYNRNVSLIFDRDNGIVIDKRSSLGRFIMDHVTGRA